LHRNFLLRAILAVLSRDLDRAALTSGSLLIEELSFKGLITLCDHLMDGELKVAHIVVAL